jgi:hypothetical protein
MWDAPRSRGLLRATVTGSQSKANQPPSAYFAAKIACNNGSRIKECEGAMLNLCRLRDLQTATWSDD